METVATFENVTEMIFSSYLRDDMEEEGFGRFENSIFEALKVPVLGWARELLHLQESS